MRVIIIGTGLAGQMVLRNLRQEGFKGEVLLLSSSSGDFYPKPILSQMFTQAKTLRSVVTATAEEIEVSLSCCIKKERVVKIDPMLKSVYTEKHDYQYDYLVLAVGARCSPMDVNGEKIFRVNHLDDYVPFYENIHRDASLAIIGGGLIGVEYAYDLSKQCKAVTLYQRGPSLLNTMVPAVVGQYIERGLVKKGVEVVLNAKTELFNRENGVYVESQPSKMVDCVLAAIGLIPEVSLAKEAGLSVSKAIDVNKYAQTSDPFIYALGDCASVCDIVKQFVPPIRACAKTIACHIVDKDYPVIYEAMPVTLKTPDIPVTFCYKAVPESWSIHEDEKGIECLAYKDNALIGFVLAGDYMLKRDQLKVSMAQWLGPEVT